MKFVFIPCIIIFSCTEIYLNLLFHHYLLQGLDDMESDLFGGSLGNKETPSKSPKPSKAAAPDSKEKLKIDKNPPTSGDPAVKSANSNKTQPIPSSSANGIRLMNCEFPVN